MFSLVIPIGRFSYFVHACLQNVLETCGSPQLLDFVFLTSQQVRPEILAAFAEARKTHQFRVVSAPFDAGSDHLRLLDWAVRNADLTDWIVVQHCDFFWRESGWLRRILGEIGPERIVVCSPCPSRYSIGSCNIPIVGDFFGCYNRRQLLQRGLSFRWGTLGREVGVSPEVAQAVRSGSIRRQDGRHIEFGQEWMDGSQAMGWELAVHDPQSVGQIDLSFLHLVAFFRIADSIRRCGNKLCCDFQVRHDAYAHYAYLTSWCIERSEVESVALPWRWCKFLADSHTIDIARQEVTGRWLRGYSWAKEVIGMDGLGLDRIDLCGESHSLRSVKLAREFLARSRYFEK